MAPEWRTALGVNDDQGRPVDPPKPRPGSRRAAFDAALRAIASPALAVHGFRFDGSRTFRRVHADGRTAAIVNFQLGQRSMEGLFTINLGVYVEGDCNGITAATAKEFHCTAERRTRLGPLMPGWMPALADLPWVGIVFGSRDRWWRLTDDPARMHASMTIVVACIADHGLPWLRHLANTLEDRA